MTDISKYKNVSLPKETYNKLDKLINQTRIIKTYKTQRKHLQKWISNSSASWFFLGASLWFLNFWGLCCSCFGHQFWTIFHIIFVQVCLFQ